MPLKRKTLLRRTGGLKRTRMKPRNNERAAKRRAECFGEQADMCRMMLCCACTGSTPTAYGNNTRKLLARTLLSSGAHVADPHHEPTRAAGGKDKDTVPLCRAHHDERHRLGRQAFEAKHGVDLRSIAAAIHEELTNVGQLS